MKLCKIAVATLASALAMGSAQAVTLDITITNLTHGQSFTPRLVVAHDGSQDLFQVGETASTALAWLAEAGVIDDIQNPASTGQNFQAQLGGTPAAENALVQNPTNNWQRFGGLLGPSRTSAVYRFDAGDFEYITMATMLIPTNDAFAGLDNIRIPTEPGTYTYTLNAYDAGTELNDELNSARTDVVEAGTGNALGGYGVPGVAGGPAPTRVVDLGIGGTGVGAQVVAGEIEDGTDGPVHIHRNVLGDTDDSAGASDLNSKVHRWLNPVARVVIVVPQP
ncbi:spondin domain-containing protein [Agarilytica rhodophyticola]|uniref:spondin domain-containing protein n=1 Tax=Agarilytica rhodophyticola TaxID=1737490 RepID=UPI000B34296A|nr:spondin domain-containing protein [Agarilytica rhodophyticola]